MARSHLYFGDWEKTVDMEDDEEAAKKQSVVDLEELYVWLQQFEDPTIGKIIYIFYNFFALIVISCNENWLWREIL